MDAAEKSSKRGHPGPGNYKDGLDMQKERNPSNDQQYQKSDYKNVRTTDFGKYSERFDNIEFQSKSNSPGRSNRG